MSNVMNTALLNTALAKTILHFIWEGGLIALTLALILKTVRRVSARVRYAAACVAMLAMLAAFAATLIHFLPRLQPVPPLQDFVWNGLQPAAGGLAPVPALPPNPLWWLGPAWMLGASLLSLRSFANWLSAQRLQRVGVCAAPEHWQQRMRQLAERIRVSRPVTLLESCLTDVPVVLGCLRPVILVPAGLLAGFPSEQIEYFLIHELAHIRRWDYVVNLFQTAAENLLFYHPAMWWVSATIRAERENCCDDVVAATGNAREFAAALAALERGRGMLTQPALAASGGNLMNRVRRLLGQPEPRRSAVAPVLLLILVMAIAVAIGAPQKPAAPLPAIVPLPSTPAAHQATRLLAQAQTKSRPPAAQPAEASADAPAMPVPYRNWLNEEVLYIISDAERQAFRNLNTDDERQKFIEQFWLRRDPTPGTPENEMQDEHYRRIAYANEHFGTPTVPGWKADRGMIYIKFGPPDEKEIHPNDATPKEIWLYRFITGIGAKVNMEFVDDARNGEYHMTKDPNAATPSPQAVQQPPNGGGRARGPAPALNPLATAIPGGLAVGQGPNGTVVTVVARAAGTVLGVHFTNRQNVTIGQLLVDLDSNNPSYNHIVSPVEGVVSGSSLEVGQHVEPGQPLFAIRPRNPAPAAAPAPQPPLSYFQSEARVVAYQAGFEASYLRLKYDEDFDGPHQKAIGDAIREVNRLGKDTGLTPSPEARAALESARALVEGVRAERLREDAAAQKTSPAAKALTSAPPWWAPDPLDPAAVARSIELTAKIQMDGTAQEVAVVRATDISLNQNAIEAVKSWRFPVTGSVYTDAYTVRVLVDPNKLARR